MRCVKHRTCHLKTFNPTKISPKTLKPNPNHAQIGMEPAIMQDPCQIKKHAKSKTVPNQEPCQIKNRAIVSSAISRLVADEKWHIRYDNDSHYQVDAGCRIFNDIRGLAL